MALDLKQYFFDSIEPSGTDPGDERIYPADDFVDGTSRALVTNGVYNGGTNCQIVPTELAYTVAMLPGRAWAEGYYLNAKAAYGDEDARHLMQLSAPTGTVRCDRIVLRLNRDFTLSGRFFKPTVISGTEGSATPPGVVREGEIYDLSLATVLVRQNTAVIPAADITDTRFDGELCGVAGFAPQPDLSVLVAYYSNKWSTEYAAALEEALSGVVSIDDIPGLSAALAGKADKAQTVLVPLPASGWGENAPYTQVVSLSALTALNVGHVFASVKLSDAQAAAQAEQEAWNCVSRVTPQEGGVVVTCFEDKPKTDVTMRLEVMD